MTLFKYDYERLSHKKVSKTKYLLIFISSIILTNTITALITLKSINNPKIITKLVNDETEIMIVDRYNEFSDKKFVNYLIELNIKFPHIVYAQAIKESNFNSNIWYENNNPFGMKVARSRPTTRIGENRGHAIYRNWRAAVIDYALLQAAFMRKIKTEEQYYEYLGLSYSVENPSEYSNAIRILANKYKYKFNKN